MFDIGIGDILNNAAALKEEQDDNRSVAMNWACGLINEIDSSDVHYSKCHEYFLVIQSLLDNNYYNYLSDVDFDVIYRLISD